MLEKKKPNHSNGTINWLISPFKSLPPVTWVVLTIFIIFSVTSSGFFTLNNMISIVRQGSFLWMLATAATIVLLSEALDLSLGSIMTFSGVVAALMLKAGFSAPLAVLGGLLVGVISGTITGLMVSVLKMPAFIASLGMLSVVGGLALAVTQANQILVIDETFLFFGGGNLFGIPMPVFIALGVFIFTYLMLNHTSFGRYIIAIGGNQMGARLSGLDVERYRWLVFVFSGTVAAIAGVVMIGRLQTADPIVGMRWEFDAVAASILGGTSTKKGKGGITGTIIGVLLIVIMRNGLNIFSLPALNITSVPAVWQTFVVGSVILIAIVFDIVVRNRGKIS
jgi:ribose transport system permease protein